MAEMSEWQGCVGESWAAEYRRTDRSFTALTEQLLTEIQQFDGRQVLDIGCGAGELALAVAHARPNAGVTGIDVSPALIQAAGRRASGLVNCSFAIADASGWDASDAPDLLISRHGVMFFDNPRAAFRHLATQAEDGADLLFSCFRSRQDNPFFTEVTRLMPESAEPRGPYAPGPFAFAEQDYVRSVLSAAGWQTIAFSRFDFAMVAGAGKDAVEDAVSYFKKIGPAAKAARQMELSVRDRFFDRIRRMADRYNNRGLVALPASTWIVTARKA